MRLCVVDIEFRGSPAALSTPSASASSGPAGQNGAGAEDAVAALYEATGRAPRNVVQDAFGGLDERQR
jgi:hypothetical protein